MKKIIFTLSCIFSVSAGYSQLSSNNTNSYVTEDKYYNDTENGCNTLIKTETYPGGQVMTSAKEPIIISNNGSPVVHVVLIKGLDGLIMNIGLIDAEVLCISKNANAEVTFTDNKKITIKHLSDLDCRGNFTCFLGEAFMNKKELDALKVKKIKQVTVTYTDLKNEELVYFKKTYNFTVQEGEKIMKTINCLSNQ